jgi:hypothetical protein
VKRHEIFARHTETNEEVRLPYRSSLWTDDGRATGDVSASANYYHIIQYGEILWSMGQAAEQHDGIGIYGTVSLSPSAHRMSPRINFDGEDATVYANVNDPIDLGLKVQSGHTGFHGLKYDVGAVRQVCSNGMMGFVSDLHFE